MDGDAALLPGAGQPNEWLICFKRTTRYRWAAWLAAGRYKHVSCFGRVAGGWMFVDFGPNAMSVAVVGDGAAADGLMAKHIDDALVLKWTPPLVVLGLRLKWAFVCTTLVAHLTGVPSSALRPDRFLKDCLAAGATVLFDDEDRTTIDVRPGARAREDRGEAR